MHNFFLTSGDSDVKEIEKHAKLPDYLKATCVSESISQARAGMSGLNN